MNGKLVGGLQVVRELHEQNCLKPLLEQVTIRRKDTISERFKNRFRQSTATSLPLVSQPSSTNTHARK